MILYHTSYMIVEKPDLEHSREYLDFGKGFYLTSLRHQTVLYSERFFLRGRQAFLCEYNLSESYSGLSVKTLMHTMKNGLILFSNVAREKTSPSMIL